MDYISPSDVLVKFEGLEGENYYTFRSRVFNIYGASQYSLSTTTAISISGKESISVHFYLPYG